MIVRLFESDEPHFKEHGLFVQPEKDLEEIPAEVKEKVDMSSGREVDLKTDDKDGRAVAAGLKADGYFLERRHLRVMFEEIEG